MTGGSSMSSEDAQTPTDYRRLVWGAGATTPTTLSIQLRADPDVVLRHRQLTLQQRAPPRSEVNSNEGEQIPELTRRLGINGKRNPLICLIPGPVINGNPTPAVDGLRLRRPLPDGVLTIVAQGGKTDEAVPAAFLAGG